MKIKLQKLSIHVVLIVITFYLSSCASILNPSFQKVKINTDEGAEVLVNNKKPKIKNGKYLIRRDASAKQITIKKEGYKDINTAIIQYRKSPYYILSVVPFSLTIFPVFYDGYSKSRDYPFNLDLKNHIKLNSNISNIAKLIELNQMALF